MTTTLNARPAVDPSAAPPPTGRPRWERPGLVLMLAGTAVLYLWNLGATGYGNSFYAAAVQAGVTSWKAFFFGSLDSANLITVDKPPASLWVMELSGRVFGFSPWSMLVPQALMAVATVALLGATVRRISGSGAGLLAGALLALTPVAALMFKFNNPDALLVLLLTAAGYATVRAIERASTRWIMLAGLAIGLAFLTKELQAFLVLPGLALAYLWAAPTGLARRIAQLLGAGAAVVVGAGWWVLATVLWPAADRPYIGGSTDNSELGRAFGYNGLGRILGQGADAAGRVGATTAQQPGRFAGMGGAAGITRMFGDQVGGQIAWLLPAALILLLAGLWLTRGAPRSNLTRAALLLWGGATVVGALVLSLMEGTFHPYYTLVLAPAIAALVVVGGREAWRARATSTGRIALGGTAAMTAVWAWELLDRTPAFLPGLRWAVLVVGLVVAVGLLVPSGLRGRAGVALVAAAVLVGTAGPAAYAVETALTPHAGAGVSAGPAVPRANESGSRDRVVAAPRNRDAGPPLGAAGFARTPDPQVTALLRTAGTRWSAATTGSSAAASLELASDTAVMGIGGFTGSDPVPTLAQFRAAVTDGQVHYFIIPGAGTTIGARAGGVGSAITQWVQQNYKATTVGAETVYNLTVPPGGGTDVAPA
jgi:4-amino-4-deoxy-L-arabinose transferase-like glycosyltransferase